MKNVLIAGGSGLIGRRLSEILVESGYSVAILTRSKEHNLTSIVKEYAWDPEKGILPDEAILDADYIVNLAGATIEKRWTKKYKEELIASRVGATRLIVEKLNTLPHHVMSLLNSSGIGYYGTSSNQLITENSLSNHEYISKICQEWERAAEQLRPDKAHLFILRITSVISSRGGVVPKIATPIKFFAGAGLGSGRQFFSWVHIDDLCRAILWCMENSHKPGIYNIASPQITTNKEFTSVLARHFHRPVILPNVPDLALKLMFGGFADSVTGSLRINPGKIMESGFKFQFPGLEGAIEDIYARKV